MNYTRKVAYRHAHSTCNLQPLISKKYKNFSADVRAIGSFRAARIKVGPAIYAIVIR
jgi:hypothetical protein